MAKISIEFDTLEKDLVVTIDGAAVENVVGVSIYPSYYDDQDGDEYHCTISTRVKDPEHDTVVTTNICASESVDAKNDLAVASEAFKGFVEVPSRVESSVAKDIATYFRR